MPCGRRARTRRAGRLLLPGPLRTLEPSLREIDAPLDGIAVPGGDLDGVGPNLQSQRFTAVDARQRRLHRRVEVDAHSAEALDLGAQDRLVQIESRVDAAAAAEALDVQTCRLAGDHRVQDLPPLGGGHEEPRASDPGTQRRADATVSGDCTDPRYKSIGSGPSAAASNTEPTCTSD